ncbi:MAG: DUF1223 domain-containing protein [Clostridia bacterium]
MRTLCLVLAMAIAPGAGAASCTAESGAQTAALVELYTSEGCDSCPPADRWLSSLGARGYAPGRVVPLSLHVDYWDYIGWKDPYAQQRFSGRQRKLTQLQRLSFVYTPQVMLQGHDFRGWRGPEFDAALARINAQPARARLRLEIGSARAGALDVEALAEVPDPARRPDAALYLAAFESKLSSQVTAGENRGSTLKHDYVVLEWLGPFELGAAGKHAEKRSIPLLPKAVPGHSGVAAFVQDRRTLEVLQALMLPACSPDSVHGRPGKG